MSDELERLRARVEELEATLDELLARERRELAGRLYDIARRIGPARLPESIRDDLEKLAHQYEFWGAKP